MVGAKGVTVAGQHGLRHFRVSSAPCAIAVPVHRYVIRTYWSYLEGISNQGHGEGEQHVGIEGAGAAGGPWGRVQMDSLRVDELTGLA